MAVNDLDLDQIIAAVEGEQTQATPLERVGAARSAATRLDALAQHVVAHFVDQARHEGASWTDIGAALGVTRQAAQQRFVPAEGVDVEAAGSRAALPYSTRATATLAAARELAVSHHHRYVDDLHLLLALLDNRSGGAVGAVKASGVRVADARKAARSRLTAEGPRRVTKNPPLGRASVRALDVAVREALRLGRGEIGTEHVLLALTSDPRTPAGQALAEAGLDYTALRDEVGRQSAQTAERPAVKRAARKRA
ncbi:Clp protease N-terminal domain-containing protein [Actinopolymorpha rutila]|uniref:Clp R domain-containing protein n=1 Tax=Actinopolymorpha rutila TaxID=446787 RepID=A0A852ZQ95_9ACTN|nr:Clp protease N-terminal domain-containing protein [Actinopolymorpha rutila]NYH90706.1 hypothetical protein [Actinopolymorpha rutila]